MKKSLLCLLAVLILTPLQAQVGYLLTASSINDLPTENGQNPERNAAQWFQTEFVNPGKGSILSLSQVAAGIDTATIKVLWVNVDRVGLASLDAAGINASVINSLRQFVEKGGHLLLTKQANTIAYSIGRMGYAPSWGNGGYTQGNDVWTINAQLGIWPDIDQKFDRRSHAVFQGMQTANNINAYTYNGVDTYYQTYPMVGAVQRTDNNNMWIDMYRRDPATGGQMAAGSTTHYENGNPQRLIDFEGDWNCQVLAVWGQVCDFCAPGLIEFKPTGSYRGTVFTCGFAAYQWGSANNYLTNIQRMTKNALNYLLTVQPASQGGTTTGGSTDSGSSTGAPVTASTRIYLNMEPNTSGRIKEEISGNNYMVIAASVAPISVPGAVGNALRTDGYSNAVSVPLTSANLSTQQLTLSCWCAAQTYPMMAVDTYIKASAPFVGNLDDDARSGFAFRVSTSGALSFECYSNSQKVTINATTKLQLSRWYRLVATMDATNHQLKIYANGVQVGSANLPGTITLGTQNLVIGRGKETNIKSGPFMLNTFNGIIDEVRIDNGIWTAQEIAAGNTPEHALDLAVPASVFENDIYRPRFHGMPSMNWTNECHGLTYSNGRFHVFFQKNGNGPYMSHLNWGHISSEDMCSWHEEPVAIAPGTGYDGKGCWSGCVFTDALFNNGLPTIIYTGVDNGKASMNMASPADHTLIDWTKAANNPVISGTPGGYDADFRDPYFFRANGKGYLIVGTGRGGVGSTCLFEWNGYNWIHLGPFFTGVDRNSCGTFFEMPNVTPMPNGKWLVTTTPLNTGEGVRTLYWVGRINADGTFTPDQTTPKTIDLEGMNKHGFGMLSPSIYNHNGTILALGIVPDKVNTGFNYQNGWAHCYSLPREWSLDSQNRLIQKPYSGLTALRTNTSFRQQNVQLNGALTMTGVTGRRVEVKADYVLAGHEVGMRLMKTPSGASVNISYAPSTNTLTVNFASLDREVNDAGFFNANYASYLPEGVVSGQNLRIHAFLDHSVLDIFVNDKWAASIRLFIRDTNANGVEIYANGPTTVSSVEAYTLEPTHQTPTALWNNEYTAPRSTGTYDLLGHPAQPMPGMLYIQDGKKYINQ